MSGVIRQVKHDCRDHVVRDVPVKGPSNPTAPSATSGDAATYHCSVCQRPLSAAALFKRPEDVLMRSQP